MSPRRRSVRRFVGILAACFSVMALFVALPATVAPAPAAQAANASDWRAGNIIDDAVFYDSNAMTSADIQAFLERQVRTCQTGATCLKDYRQNTDNRPADKYCDGYSGQPNERASTIIDRVARSCGISQKVLLVLLQKEQSLVTSTAPSAWAYSAATGQGCPDTAPCDSATAGFFYQVYYAARQYEVYRLNPTWWGYQAGRWNNILYHPDGNRGCGSARVFIENQATAGLYIYTPYTPNTAALNNMYGEGDRCSSYGNRNFWRLFTDWFGSTRGESMQLLQVAGTSERYIVSMGGRWRLATPEIAAQFTWISAVREVSRAQLEVFEDRGNAKRAVRTESGIVYLLDSGGRLRARDVWQVGDFGWDYGALPLASDAQVSRYRDAGWLERTVRSGGRSYLIQSGSKREVVDLGILPRFGIPALAADISPTMLAEYPTAAPVISAGVYRDATNPYRFQTDAGAYVVPDAASGTTIARSARELAADSFAFLRASSYMPVRMTSGGKSFVMLEDGWLELSASEYPASLGFTTLPDGAATGLGTTGRISGPHFVRERSSSQTYLVSSGTVTAVSSSDQAWVTRTYGVHPRVWVVLDGAIGDAATTEGLVRNAAGTAYLLDGARAYRLRDCAQVAAWGGNCASLPTVTDAKIRGYADAGTLDHLVRTPAGTIWLPQDGQLRQVLDTAILAVYGIPATTSAISTATAAKLAVGEPVLGVGVYSDGGAARVVATPSGEYTLTPEQSVGVIADSVRRLTGASFAKITVDGALPSRLRSDNRSFVLTREGWLEVSAAAYGGDAVFSALPAKAWQGIPVAANETRPHYVRDDASGQEYLVSGGAVQPVSGAAERALITATYGVPTKVWPVVSGVLTGLKVNHDAIVKDAAGAVYLIDGTTRYRMSGCAAVPDFGKDCATLRILTAAQLDALRDGGALAPLLRSPEGYTWLIQSGTRREVPDPRVLAVYGIGGAATAVSNQLLAQIRLGQPVAAPGAYDDRAGDVRVVTGDGRVFIVPAASRIGSVTSAAWTISPASIDLLTAEGDLPTRITAGATSYVLTSEGWLAVDAAAYAPLAFSSVGGRASEGLPSAGAEPRPHFVRQQSDPQVYLVSGGLTTVADDATRAWISATYGVPAKVWIVPNGALR